MQIRKVSYARGITLNIGNFESVRVDIQAEGEVSSGETFDQAFASLKEEVDEALNDELVFIRKRSARSGS
jgi:hypothetical protein